MPLIIPTNEPGGTLGQDTEVLDLHQTIPGRHREGCA